MREMKLEKINIECIDEKRKHDNEGNNDAENRMNGH